MWKLTIPIVLVVVAVKASSDYYCTRSCPPFWTSFGRSCYRYFGQPRTWIDGEEVCKGFAGTRGLGHLVSIVSDDENSFITQLVTYIRTIETSEIHEACSARHQDATDEMINNSHEDEGNVQAEVPQGEADPGKEEPILSPDDKVPPTQMVQSKIQQTLTWIGLSDLKRIGEFSWSDGTKVSFTNWIGQQNIDNIDNWDSRDYKGKERKSTDAREKRSADKTSPQSAGNSCAHIVPVVNAVGSQRTWEKRACNDTATTSPFVCRILWI